MADKPEKVAYLNKTKSGRFSFYRADGSEVVISDEEFETDDPNEIAYLDGVSFVKRAGGKSAAKDDE